MIVMLMHQMFLKGVLLLNKETKTNSIRKISNVVNPKNLSDLTSDLTENPTVKTVWKDLDKLFLNVDF